MQKVTLVNNARIEEKYPRESPASVRIMTLDGRLNSESHAI